MFWKPRTEFLECDHGGFGPVEFHLTDAAHKEGAGSQFVAGEVFRNITVGAFGFCGAVQSVKGFRTGKAELGNFRSVVRSLKAFGITCRGVKNLIPAGDLLPGGELGVGGILQEFVGRKQGDRAFQQGTGFPPALQAHEGLGEAELARSIVAFYFFKLLQFAADAR